MLGGGGQGLGQGLGQGNLLGGGNNQRIGGNGLGTGGLGAGQANPLAGLFRRR